MSDVVLTVSQSRKELWSRRDAPGPGSALCEIRHLGALALPFMMLIATQVLKPFLTGACLWSPRIAALRNGKIHQCIFSESHVQLRSGEF